VDLSSPTRRLGIVAPPLAGNDGFLRNLAKTAPCSTLNPGESPFKTRKSRVQHLRIDCVKYPPACSLSLGTASAPASQGFGRRLPSRSSRRSRWDLPGSGGILVNVPCCLTPVGRPQPRLGGWVDAAFRLSELRRPHMGSFRGSITQPVDSLSTLRVEVALAHARLASGPLASTTTRLTDGGSRRSSRPCSPIRTTTVREWASRRNTS
jgi:hypothetical protein